MMFVAFISLGHETIVPINLIKLTKMKTKHASVENKKEGVIYNRYYFTAPYIFPSSGWFRKKARRALIVTVRLSGWVGHASATFAFSPNFSQVYMEFCKSVFSWSERLTYYVLKYDNFKSVGVHSWTSLKILIFLHSSWDLYFHYASRKTPCYFTLNGCAAKCKSATTSLHRGDSLSLTCIVSWASSVL